MEQARDFSRYATVRTKNLLENLIAEVRENSRLSSMKLQNNRLPQIKPQATNLRRIQKLRSELGNVATKCTHFRDSFSGVLNVLRSFDLNQQAQDVERTISQVSGPVLEGLHVITELLNAAESRLKDDTLDYAKSAIEAKIGELVHGQLCDLHAKIQNLIVTGGYRK